MRRLPRVALSATLLLPMTVLAGEGPAEALRPHDRAAVVAAAREFMATQKYCALVTLDETGRPQVRTMNPFPPDDDLSVWFATNMAARPNDYDNLPLVRLLLVG